MKTVATAVFLSIFMLGCAPVPVQPDEPVDYGPAPTDYQAAIKAYMAAHLKDPDSARYTFYRAPVQAWNNTDWRAYGWATCASVNAKNSYGGYTGNQQHYFFFRNDAVFRTASADGAGGMRDAVVAKMCESL